MKSFQIGRRKPFGPRPRIRKLPGDLVQQHINIIVGQWRGLWHRPGR